MQVEFLNGRTSLFLRKDFAIHAHSRQGFSSQNSRVGRKGGHSSIWQKNECDAHAQRRRLVNQVLHSIVNVTIQCLKQCVIKDRNKFYFKRMKLHNTRVA